jgi:hypothetical protein
MKANLTFITYSEKEGENAEVVNFEMENIQHIPRIGEMIFHNGRDYTVFELTWNFEKDVVFIWVRWTRWRICFLARVGNRTCTHREVSHTFRTQNRVPLGTQPSGIYHLPS